MTLHFYETASGKNLIFDYLDHLTVNESVDGYTVLQYMENGEMEKVRFKQWERKIYEVYFYRHNRMFYVTVAGEDVYFLHACKKQKNRTEKKDKQIVEKRARELEKLLGISIL